MKKKNKSILPEYKADELGLPLIIRNVPIIEIEGHEVLDIDYSKISELLFASLILKPFPLTGAEVRFMRLFMGLTLESLAESLHVTHPTILGWERYGNEPTKMTDTTEAILRIFAAKQGAKDNELIGIILDKFFSGSKKDPSVSKSATIVELDAEFPRISFSNEEEDLRFLQC